MKLGPEQSNCSAPAATRLNVGVVRANVLTRPPPPPVWVESHWVYLWSSCLFVSTFYSPGNSTGHPFSSPVQFSVFGLAAGAKASVFKRVYTEEFTARVS